MTTTPTLDQLKRALVISEQIAALEAEMAAIFNGSTPTSSAKVTPAQADGRKGKKSPATIAKMKASQQARWAKLKGTKAPAATKAAAKAPVKKFKMSAQGLANIKAAQKKRWAKIKAAKKAPAKAPAPKAVVVKKHKPMSAEAKAKLSAMMKARWEAKQAAAS